MPLANSVPWTRLVCSLIWPALAPSAPIAMGWVEARRIVSVSEPATAVPNSRATEGVGIVRLDVGGQLDRPHGAALVDGAGEAGQFRRQRVGRVDRRGIREVEARAVFDEVRAAHEAPVVRHAQVGLDRAHRVARRFLQAGRGVVRAVQVPGLAEDRDRAGEQESADGEGHHELDEAQAVLLPRRFVMRMRLHVWNPIWKVTGAASPTSAHCTVTT